MRPPIVKVNAPVPYSGGKDAVGAVVWQRFGDVRNLVIPFAGMLGILRARPWPPANGKPYTETVNDLDGGLSNALRALALRPDEVVEALTIRIGDEPDEARTIRPTSELDQRAWARRLVKVEPDLRERLGDDEGWCDPVLAAGWLWGASTWLGSGWPADRAQIPSLGAPAGRGVHARDGLQRVLTFARRIRNVRVVCGDWRRVLTRTVLGQFEGSGMTPTAVYLDPDYEEGDVYHASEGTGRLVDDVVDTMVELAERWPMLRVGISKYADDRPVPDGWDEFQWSTTNRARGAGRARTAEALARAGRERIWFSPACLPPRRRVAVTVLRQTSLFEPEVGTSASHANDGEGVDDGRV